MTLPRGVVIALVSALVLALMVIAFLLGRESERRQIPLAPPPTPSAPFAQRPPEVMREKDLPPPAAPPWSRGGPEVPRPPPKPASQQADRDAVAAYFHAIETLGPEDLGGKPEEVAQKLVASLVTGEAAGLGDLVRTAEESERKAAALVPPEPCKDHHQRLVSLLGESTALLRKVDGALARKDYDSLSTLGGSASALQSRAEALEAEAKSLKTRYGIR